MGARFTGDTLLAHYFLISDYSRPLPIRRSIVGASGAGTAILSTVRAVSFYIDTFLILVVAGIRPVASKPHIVTNKYVHSLDVPDPLVFANSSTSAEHIADAKAIFFVVDANHVPQWPHRGRVRWLFHRIYVPGSLMAHFDLVLSHKCYMLKTESVPATSPSEQLAINGVRTVLERDRKAASISCREGSYRRARS